MFSETFDRTARLIGNEALDRMSQARVILFGVGGVGSWAAETLVRTGIARLTIVDADRVAESNINRQLPALTSTVGQVKVDVLRQRLLDINPQAEITAVHGLYNADTASSSKGEGIFPHSYILSLNFTAFPRCFFIENNI